MAQHKARTHRPGIGLALTAICALLFAGVSPAGADVPPVAPGKTAIAKDSHVTTICKMTVQAVNASTGQVSIRLAAEAKPTSFNGYITNAYTQAFCWVNDAGGNVVTSYNPSRNSATVPNSAIQALVAYSPSYTVCARGFVKLTNGNQYWTPVVCS